MNKLANRLLAASLAALAFLSFPALAGVTVTPSARSLEQNGNIVPAASLIPYLLQLQSNAAATYGTTITATVNNAAGTTITAGNILGVMETRTGAAAVTDTTDTAANIIAAIPGVQVGSTAVWQIQNQNTGTLTLAGGTGVTLAGQIVVPTNQVWTGLVNVASGTAAATLTQQGAGYSSTAPPTVTISGGSCSGVVAAATVPAGANFVSAITVSNAGSGCVTPSAVTCTISAPTVSGALTVQATCAATITPTAVTITGYSTGPQASLPASVYVATAAGNGTMTAGQMTGANFVTLDTSGATAFTTRTAAQLFADTPNAYVGQTWIFRTRNSNAGTLTYTGGTGVTFATVGSANTLLTNTTRDHQCTFVTSSTVTCQNLGAGTF